MTDQAHERFEALKAYFDKLPDKEKEQHAAKGQAHEGAVFNLIKEGDGVGLYASIQKDPGLLEKQDENGMTPLHWASADKSGLAHEITTSHTSSAPWTLDKFERSPLDVAREAERSEDQVKLEQITYPQIHRTLNYDEPVKEQKIEAHYQKLQEVNAKQPEKLEMFKAEHRKEESRKQPPESDISNSRGRER
jgi:hypothetical protein